MQVTRCPTALLTASLILTAIGCGPERLKVDDLPRRELKDVVVASPSPGVPPNPMAAENQQNPEHTRDEAFRAAAMQGDLPGVKKLAAEGSQIDAPGEGGRTALQLASFDGHLEIVKWLIAHDAKVNHFDEFGRTALMYAATGDNGSTVKALLAAGAELESVDAEEHFTALMFAAAEGQAEVVRILLNAGADPARLDIDGESAFDFARNNGHDDVVKALQNK